ncbi:MAG: hypothetical protein FWG44_05160 [Oscillospiraceae bacterium]|nr:hypothetical protein [Oscillospiraceae bacterium]
MRIAGNTVLRRYMHNLERNMGNKNKAENQLYSARYFNRASENPIKAARALRVRKAINDLDTYQDNLRTANAIYENAESSVMKVSSIMQSVYEHLIKGAHGSYNEDDAEIIADSIDRFAEEMVQLMNIIVADRRIFGGVNNSSLAFKIENGNAYYHGIPLNQYQNPELFPYNGISYTDIGIGMTLNSSGRIDPQSALPITFNGAEILGCGLDSKKITFDLDTYEPGRDYSINVSIGKEMQTVKFTAPGAIGDLVMDKDALVDTINDALFKTFNNRYITVGKESGLVTNNVAGKPEVSVISTPYNGNPTHDTYLPAGITSIPNGFSANVIQLVMDSAQALKDDDRFLAAQYADALFALQTNVSLTIAKIGNTEEFIEFNLDRTTNNRMTLLEQQKDLEASKPEEQITMIKVLESIFSAQLQMGAQIVPMSIFNFIR